jgi:uncharacterized metal-binding protein YceD (DUF177 family)
MVIANEFSFIVKLSEIGDHSRAIMLSADDMARSGLVARFDLAALASLDASIALEREAGDVVATGRFTAQLAQFCIASNDAVAASLDEPIHIRFIPEPTISGEIELEADDCETMFHDGQTIDLGEAVAQSLGLALNPYPRSLEAERALKAAGVKGEEDAQPVAGAFASLKDLLAGK